MERIWGQGCGGGGAEIKEPRGLPFLFLQGGGYILAMKENRVAVTNRKPPTIPWMVRPNLLSVIVKKATLKKEDTNTPLEGRPHFDHKYSGGGSRRIRQTQPQT